MLLLLPAFLFVFLVAAITFAGHAILVRPHAGLRRLSEPVGPVPVAPRVSPLASMGGLLESLGALVPVSPQDIELTRAELAAAGFRSRRAVTVFYGIKLVAAAALLILDVLFRQRFIPNPILSLVSLIGLPVLGYLGVGFALDAMISSRAEKLRLALPDALDLMVVCSEGGSALDQAILKVSQELKAVHPALAEEFATVNFEMLAGKPREEALRNLGQRTREPELRKFTSVLVQTDRFGTSMVDTLKAQAEYLRVRRRQVAHEKAAKVGVKIIFPIFFLCFPAMLIVVAGPGILQLIKNLFPVMRQMH
ncbi:MAG TPA: type II secretion system F family protein [Bryobacteraceae bacterium]|jgi:tight adherence protein C